MAIADIIKYEGENSTFIITPGKSNSGTQFSVGDAFKILEKDGDATLIEKENDPNNPYFVSAKFLQTISNYKEATNNDC